jgi:hypothetical protein
MKSRVKVQNLESYYVREARKTRERQNATILVCALITFGVIVWSVLR